MILWKTLFLHSRRENVKTKLIAQKTRFDRDASKSGSKHELKKPNNIVFLGENFRPCSAARSTVRDQLFLSAVLACARCGVS